jgi:preprotein translocase subunit SecF
VLIALIIFGPTSTKVFAMMLTAGMFFGTYSSIFLASPLLVTIQNWGKK